MKWFSSFLLLILGISLSTDFKAGNTAKCISNDRYNVRCQYDSVNKVFRLCTSKLGTIPLFFQLDSCRLNRDSTIDLSGYIGMQPNRDRISKKDTYLIKADSSIDLQGLWNGKYDKLRRDTSRGKGVYIILALRNSFGLFLPKDTLAISDDHCCFGIKKLAKKRDGYLIFYGPKDWVYEYETVCIEGFF